MKSFAVAVAIGAACTTRRDRHKCQPAEIERCN